MFQAELTSETLILLEGIEISPFQSLERFSPPGSKLHPSPLLRGEGTVRIDRLLSPSGRGGKGVQLLSVNEGVPWRFLKKC